MERYEFNNNFEEAKFIPKDEIIGAFANRGSEGYGAQEVHRDCYKVVLNESAKIQVELLKALRTILPIFGYRTDQSSLSTPAIPISGNPAVAEHGTSCLRTTANTLDPGTPYIHQAPERSGRSAQYRINERNFSSKNLRSHIATFIFVAK